MPFSMAYEKIYFDMSQGKTCVISRLYFNMRTLQFDMIMSTGKAPSGHKKILSSRSRRVRENSWPSGKISGKLFHAYVYACGETEERRWEVRKSDGEGVEGHERDGIQGDS